MTELIPSLGRSVHYVLSTQNAEQINRRRTNGSSIAVRMKEVPPAWPAGAQAHIGNEAQEGQVLSHDDYPRLGYSGRLVGQRSSTSGWE